MKNGICPKCDSRDIIPDVRVIDRTGDGNIAKDLTAQLYEKPYALLFKGAKSYAIRAWICGACGYTELYTEIPKELFSMYKTNQIKTA
jgi:predicted nucleic-acid-binding Zn-ribbon protein